MVPCQRLMRRLTTSRFCLVTGVDSWNKALTKFTPMPATMAELDSFRTELMPILWEWLQMHHS
eukprot:12904818-Prorocentrum_lima.AAC.1